MINIDTIVTRVIDVERIPKEAEETTFVQWRRTSSRLRGGAPLSKPHFEKPIM